MSFSPYVPPNEGAGLLTVDRDLCWRINARGLVTPAVIGAVCWARNNFRMSDTQQLAILDGLGLEYHQLPAGGTILRPKTAHRIALFSKRVRSDDGKPMPPSSIFSLTTPVLPLTEYDAVEVYPTVDDNDAVGRFDVQDHVHSTEPQFWSVALHLVSGGIETIADFPDQASADTFGELMRGMVIGARQAEGLDISRLKSENPLVLAST